MANISPSLVFIVCVFTVHTSLEASYCDDVKYITIDDPRRSTAYNSSYQPEICDRAIIQDNAWYRFLSAAGGELPTTKPVPETCGTAAPIWMNGSHPSVEERSVTRKVCANVNHKHPFGCAYHYNIKVRNCSGYYIYQLRKPKTCYLAYCAGSKLPNCTNAHPEDYCLENRPPYISMPLRYYALEDSKFELKFNATDPEGYPMRYSLSNSTVSSVSVNPKRKLVSISVKKSGSVSLKVKDYPYKSSEDIHTIRIVTIPCKCQNGGKCYNIKNVSTNREDFSNPTCVCVEPYTGQLCQANPCDKLPCFPEVNCSVTSDGYKCGMCPPKFEGDGENCQLILSSDDDVVVEAEMKIVSGLKWNDSLSDKTSYLYKSETAKIIAEIKQAFSGNKEFLGVVVTRYRNESGVVEFQVILNEKTNDPLEPLRTHATQNKFGNFTVDPNSIKEKRNRPPYISMPHRYYALEDSKFELAFNATDPEGYPMRYSHLSNSTVSSVSVDQEHKLVNISVKKSGSVSLKAKDYGGREDIHTIEIVTIPCKCQNKGKCYNKKKVSTNRDDFSNPTCACVGPFTGHLCQVTPCANLPCFPEVNCYVTSDGYECGMCPPKFEGDGKNCQLILGDDDVVVEAELKIVSGLKWNDSLLVKTSYLYKSETAKIIAEIKQAFSENKEFLGVVVTRYRYTRKNTRVQGCLNSIAQCFAATILNNTVEPESTRNQVKGSVVVEFQVVLKEKSNDPLEPLRTHAKQNKFGSFKVDQHSIKEENSTEVEGTLNVVSGLEWKDDLLNKGSSYFETVSFRIQHEISKVYEEEEDFVYVFVTDFRKKNFLVEFKLVWLNKTSKHKALDKLKLETQDGGLGNLKIKKNSVKEKTTEGPSNDPSYFGLHKVVFIVLICLVSILLLVVIVVCGVCIRKKHVSIIMLTTNDDHHQFCENNRSEDFQMKKRPTFPARNQVVDIHSA